MKKISIHSRKLPFKYFLVDDEDYWRCVQYKWHSASYKHNTIMTRINNKRINLSNFIMNDFDNRYDHIDINSFNNQKQNLRIATHQQNNCNKNKEIRLKMTSQYKGVYWNKQSKKFLASIRLNRKFIYLGLFTNEKDAALAYDRKALELFGEFANLNFKEEK